MSFIRFLVQLLPSPPQVLEPPVGRDVARRSGAIPGGRVAPSGREPRVRRDRRRGAESLRAETPQGYRGVGIAASAAQRG